MAAAISGATASIDPGADRDRPDNALWFTEETANRIGRLTP